MRRQKTIKIQVDEKTNLEVTVYEVRPKDVWADFKTLTQAKDKEARADQFGQLVEKCCSLTPQQLSELYPSDLEELVTAWKEVNAAFLSPWPTIKKVIEKAGLGDWLADVINQSGLKDLIGMNLAKDWGKLVRSSRNVATPAQGITDGSSS